MQREVRVTNATRREGQCLVSTDFLLGSYFLQMFLGKEPTIGRRLPLCG